MSYQSSYQSSFSRQQQSGVPASSYSNQQSSSYGRQENTSSYSRNESSSYGATQERSAINAPSSSTNQYQIEGRNEQLLGDNKGFLKWASDLNNATVYDGSSDYVQLTNLKNAIFELQSSYFNPKSGLAIKGAESDEAQRRFLLIEHEIEGLLRRRIDVNTKDHVSAERVMNYTQLMHEKESEIIELESRIKNLEGRLAKSEEGKRQLNLRIDQLVKQNLSLKGNSGRQLDDAVRKQRQFDQAQIDLKDLRASFEVVVGAWKNQIDSYRVKHPHESWDIDASILQKLRASNINGLPMKDFAFIEVRSENTVNVPIADVRTKHLLSLFATNLKTLSERYPKLKAEFHPEITEFFQQEIIDTIECDAIDRLVEIVKFVPQTVRVENVYSYTSSKQRKTEFHLRVLLKALLEQVGKATEKTGAVLDIDEGVVGMINKEILDIVCVDDILKVYRGAPKLLQVEKIVEKVVEKVVEVPKVVTVKQQIEKPIEVPKAIEIETTRHVPVELVKEVTCQIEKIVPQPTIEEKIVEVATVKEKLVTEQREIPKLIEVEKIVEKIVKDIQVVEVPRTQYIEVPKKEIVEVITEKIVELTKEIQVPKPIEVLVEKIVTVEVPKVEIVEIERIVEKPVERIVHIPVKETDVAIKEVIKEVIVEREKIVPIRVVDTQILEVTKRVEVPVPVREVIEKIKEVKVVEQKFVEVEKIKEIPKVSNHVVREEIEVIKEVDRRIEVPIVHEKVKTVTLEVPRTLIERVHIPHIVPVTVVEQKLVEVCKIKQVEKPVTIYVPTVQVVNCQVEKIVPVETIRDRIKEVKVKVEKVVNKLVEVPKVVEVEKIVEKIVPVPRVIETIVEVPQIIEKIVEKEIIRTEVIEVPKITEKIVEVVKPVEVEKIRNIYTNVPEPVEIKTEVPVPAIQEVEREKEVKIFVDKLVEVQVEKPVQVMVDKVVPFKVEEVKVVELEKDRIVEVRLPYPVEKITPQVIPVEHIVPEEVHLVEKVDQIVPIRTEIECERPVEVVVEKLVERKVPTVHQETKVVVNTEPQLVEVVVEKHHKIPEYKPTPALQVDRFVEKVVEHRTTNTQLKPIDRTTDKVIEIKEPIYVNNNINHIATEHKVVEACYDRVVPAPSLQTCVEAVNICEDKLVCQAVVTTEIQKVPECHEKIVTQKDAQVYENCMTKVICEPQIVEVQEIIERAPEIIERQVLANVPEFQEKIVERIVVMPQIVEVLKYVTEICEAETLATGVSVDVVQQEKNYLELYGVAKRQLEIVITELEKIKGSQPNLRGVIELLGRYLIDFDKLAAVQRIVPVDREKIVEKEVTKPVLVPTKDSATISAELSHTLLIDKLVQELTRIKKENPNVNFKLDNEIGLFFFSEFYNKSNINTAGNFKQQLEQYTSKAMKSIQNWDWDWNSDQTLILNSFIQDRFTLGATIQQANIEIERAREEAKSVHDKVVALENQFLPVEKRLAEKEVRIKRIVDELKAKKPELTGLGEIQRLIEGIDEMSIINIVPMNVLDGFSTASDSFRASSRLREIQMAYDALLQFFNKGQDIMGGAIGGYSPQEDANDKTAQRLNPIIMKLRSENERMNGEIKRLNESVSRFTSEKNQMTRDSSRLRQEMQELRRNQSSVGSSRVGSSTNEADKMEIRRLNEQIAELTNTISKRDVELKTSKARIVQLENQLNRSNLRIKQLESQLTTTKDVQSSAATESNNRLVESSYSSASSSTLNNPISRSQHQPSYETSSSNYSTEGGRGETKQTSSYIQSGSTYTTGGTSVYQPTSTSTYSKQVESSSSYTSSSKPVETAAYSKPLESTTYGSNRFGTAEGERESGYASSSRYASSTSGPSYGVGTTSGYGTGVTTNVTTTTTGGTTGGVSSSSSYSMSSSNMRSSGTGASNLSSYTFQTKK